MLIKVDQLHGWKLDSLNGNIGKILDFYFDDKYWVVRYLIADTGDWLTGRQVLLSPYALGSASKEDHTLAVALTKEQIEESPALSTDKPISKQFEKAYHGFYGWKEYWAGPNIWGSSQYLGHDRYEPPATSKDHGWDPSLRSCEAVKGYHIEASDGGIGHVEDFILDDETWEIRYLVIDTRDWWPGKKVLVSTKWIERVSWSESKLTLNISRESIKHAPEYSDENLVTRDYETKLHRHYDRQGYWNDVALSLEPFPLK